MSRIRIGNKNGRMGFWVSAAGYDADQEIAKWLLNSDYDQLKLLHSLTGEVSASQGISLPETTVVSWTNLGYVPLCFVTIRGSTNSKQYYPFTGAMWTDSGTQTFGYLYWRVYSDHLSIGTAASYVSGWNKYEVTCHVFALDLPLTVLS
ncbi:MAG: hypothetical protein ACTHKQ_21890 [Mesorhizobium sp.]